MTGPEGDIPSPAALLEGAGLSPARARHMTEALASIYNITPRNRGPLLFAPSEHVPRDAIRPEVIILRYAEPSSEGRVRVRLPCHDLERIYLNRQQTDLPAVLAACRECRRLYAVTITADERYGEVAKLAYRGFVVLSMKRIRP